ncbi:low molecular weight phosphotyrosine protein phosphatase [Vibrio sp. JC009]|uniref:low molecular weight protein-tyrosine-phosphatase n=1 Tax=Vibrio sp. JC009 TaxID=2912314 RepID=UPI0023AFD0B6|nr:low molecular weight protein-tyrosine-phosphatase [Vibrio sp. JC009]WED20605.1 low molecular weight phosphotyrosine protein phosphatase [Vibrio sp. JC009]
MFNSILVICAGNICRSPYGEFRLKALLPGKKITSAGVATKISNLQDKPADILAIEVAGEFNADITEHRAKQVTQELVDEYDLILCMERNQLEKLCELHPTARHKSFVFGHWVGSSTIEDPYQKDVHAFRQAFTNIDNAAESWARKLG